MPTSKFHVAATVRGTDEYDSNLKEVSSSVPYSSSAVKHEYDEHTVSFATEVATTTEKIEGHNLRSDPITTAGIAHDKSLPSPDKKKRRVKSPSPTTKHNAVAYGALGFNQAFSYPAPLSAAAFPGQSPHPAHSKQPIQQLETGQVFPGQSPPFPFQNDVGYFSGMDNGLQMLMAPKSGTPQPQPITITHMPPGHTYATVPYPYVNHYPSGQPLIQHPSGKFYPAIMNVVSSDQRGHPTNDASMLSRIVDNPPNPPESALSQPKKWVRWTDMEDMVLKAAVKKYGEDQMDFISRRIFYNTRDTSQVRQRWRKQLQPGLVKGKWTKEEDAIILEVVKASSVPGGDGESQTKWSDIAKHLPGRLGEQVKARWANHLDPEIRKGVWTKAEMDLLTEAQKELGNKWAAIAQRIPGRSENSVKNRWYNAKTSLKRKAEREAEEAEERRQREEFLLSRRADNDDRRSSTESVQSLIFKTEESESEY